MKNVRTSFTNKHRDSWMEVNLQYLEENIEAIKKNIKNFDKKELLAVIKADGYGHGSIMIAPTLTACGIKNFGVASIDEGIELRQNDIKSPILVLGAAPAWALETAHNYDITVSVFNASHIEAIKMFYQMHKKPVKVQVKIDTGMNRIGINYKEAAAFINEIRALECINLEGVFTHFADAENPEILKMQKERFDYVLDNINTEGLKIHCQNSLGAFITDDDRYNCIRLGIVLYGLSPLTMGVEPVCKMPDIKQLVSIKGRITNVHTIQKGEGVSYGYKFIAEKETRVATIPIGYADGISRNLSGKIKGFLNGVEIPQIGRITMDQMMFDITDVEGEAGDIVTILGYDGFGNFISVDKWAEFLNTINYELTCRLKVRLPRVYTREED